MTAPFNGRISVLEQRWWKSIPFLPEDTHTTTHRKCPPWGEGVSQNPFWGGGGMV